MRKLISPVFYSQVESRLRFRKIIWYQPSGPDAPLNHQILTELQGWFLGNYLQEIVEEHKYINIFALKINYKYKS
ncbi:hypothetical protein DU80_03045 [Methanosarcina mazei]|uniref:Uncharacterized protein n=1 Tax=Methanosarcina mazei TaxID=2209 RepID=A0A0F8CHK7_METMZ|nr:hypothetical protein DU40_09805 [Methanosarcina mazei]KKG04399.1 hypothetical protein DU47_15620 [Methanosarcina mazei]KKG05018.1 hypothetical protein DU31_07750 [Methanosarcina mazei]KKG08558.1 hypothetical protein DU34_10825 [Methanosarcina mazei]KKG33462.1 hypothetical protein DU49_06200 [Methanosarcina mazei]